MVLLAYRKQQAQKEDVHCDEAGGLHDLRSGTSTIGYQRQSQSEDCELPKESHNTGAFASFGWHPVGIVKLIVERCNQTVRAAYSADA